MHSIVSIGLYELAGGAMLGWVVATEHAFPDLLRRIGIAHPRRILQAHLDYIIMGVILIAVGLAIPDLPRWISMAIVAGTVVNPALFFPLAFRDDISKTLAYRAISVLSFIATSGGLLAAAIDFSR